ncbi:Error-prone repair protein ImuA [Segetibacter sp. 3557_3]|uniref:ImuA family protein n=1 Tax=Segetibacter sp. 3557_3 TaxID=2547429 RepID=UPI001058B2F9|nr:Error-prone repair protein ImuA [Segetibacter sp. 3557_3]TDH20676.1 Error-prone repair protein ImuA [Segetibacter sp. 3557_3]
MEAQKSDIIRQLQKDILLLQGFKACTTGTVVDVGLGPVNMAFPNETFPLGAVHEFISTSQEETAATGGFISGLLSPLMRNNGVTLWISRNRMLFPPSLKFFGIDPARFIFVDLHKESDVIWAIEEGLKCDGLAAVVGELADISFTASRRLQLAVEQSKVTGFIIRQQPRKLAVTACVSQWKISPVPGDAIEDLPGVGFARWKVTLLKVRNGKPGSWELDWAAGKFRHVPQKAAAIAPAEMRKTG